MEFAFRPISQKRMEELKQMNFSDIPDDFWVLRPFPIYDMYICSEDEQYMLGKLDQRLRDERNKKDSCFVLFYGQNHFFFDAYVEGYYRKYEGDDYYYTVNIWIRKNCRIEDFENKEEMLVIIRDALSEKHQLYRQKNVKWRKTVCTIYYDEELIK